MSSGTSKKKWKNGSAAYGDIVGSAICRSENTLTTLGVTFAATSAIVAPPGSVTVACDGGRAIDAVAGVAGGHA